MSDIFSGDGGGGDGWIGWNAKTFKWTVNGDPADPKSMLVDARSFVEGWIQFNPSYDAVFPHPEDGPIAQPGETYKGAWLVRVFTDEWLDFKFTSWSVFKVFKKIAPAFRDQPDGKVTQVTVTGELLKDNKGNAGPILEVVGFVDDPRALTLVPPAAAVAPAPAAAGEGDKDAIF